jgi:hypothetical protein
VNFENFMPFGRASLKDGVALEPPPVRCSRAMLARNVFFLSFVTPPAIVSCFESFALFAIASFGVPLPPFVVKVRCASVTSPAVGGLTVADGDAA